MATGKYPKVKCTTCDQMVDPRGMGAHRRSHNKPLQELAEKTASNGDLSSVVMVPVPRSVIMEIVHEWLQAGAHKK